jgi:uroporphyrinogen-III synthase
MRPLEGFVVGVTADRRWQEQAELLERRGASVLHGPSITTLYLDCDEELRRMTRAVVAEPPEYVVATTGIGMRAWMETAAVWGLGDDLVGSLQSSRIVARGPKAAAAVQAAGLTVWARSSTERMDDVLTILLAEPLSGRRVVIQQYGMETPELTTILTATGATVVEVPVYRWRVPEDKGPAQRLVQAVCEGAVDAITFTSAPAVHNLFAIAADQQADEDLRRAFNDGVVAACVGPVCAEGARQEGVVAPLAPDVGRLGLLVRALSDHFELQRRAFRIGGTDLLVQGSAILVDGQRGVLTPRERAVFELLASTPGAVVSRDALLEGVWGSTKVDPHLVEVTVGRLRRRLGRCGGAIQAVSGRGYRLVTDAERIEVG